MYTGVVDLITHATSSTARAPDFHVINCVFFNDFCIEGSVIYVSIIVHGNMDLHPTMLLCDSCLLGLCCPVPRKKCASMLYSWLPTGATGIIVLSTRPNRHHHLVIVADRTFCLQPYSHKHLIKSVRIGDVKTFRFPNTVSVVVLVQLCTSAVASSVSAPLRTKTWNKHKPLVVTGFTLIATMATVGARVWCRSSSG